MGLFQSTNIKQSLYWSILIFISVLLHFVLAVPFFLLLKKPEKTDYKVVIYSVSEYVQNVNENSESLKKEQILENTEPENSKTFENKEFVKKELDVNLIEKTKEQVNNDLVENFKEEAVDGRLAQADFSKKNNIFESVEASGGIYNPKPDYPRELQRAGIGGSVKLQIFIMENGRIADVEILSSSGNGKLDNSAMNTVKNFWKFMKGEERVLVYNFNFIP